MKLFILITLLLPVMASSQIKIKIRENTRIAKIVARLHGTPEYAMTIGNTIYLSCSAEEFLEDIPWMYHEFTHITQYRRLGNLEFFKRYIFYMIIYQKHDSIPFEKEANYYEDNLIVPNF